MLQRTNESEQEPVVWQRSTSRRSFLRWSGAAVTVLAITGCDDDDNITGGDGEEVRIDLSNDFGVLNFAYALEQLEAAFYTQVVASMYAGATAEERAVLEDIRDHEVAHREFFKAALAGNAIPALTPNFSSVNFGNRQSVLQTAQTFEDLGVGAYNGAGKFLASKDFLTIAGKIVSVEARHASVIRDLLSPKTSAFAPKAFDDALSPTAVLQAAAPFIRTSITLANAPA